MKTYCISGDHLASLTRNYGINDLLLVSDDEQMKIATQTAVLENIFDPTVGNLAYNLFLHFGLLGLKKQIMYDILCEVFMDIEGNYDILVDSKSRINEVVSIYKLGMVKHATSTFLPQENKAMCNFVLWLHDYDKNMMGIKKGSRNKHCLCKGMKYIEHKM